MEAISAFSAILTIATEFNRIYKRLRRCMRTLKYARDDIEAICDEVDTFSSLLCMFHTTVTDAHLADEGLSTEIRASKMARGIVKSGKGALKKLKDILDEVEPLRTDKAYPLFAQWIARWKWSSCKEEWMPIQISLISIKESANMLMTIIWCQHILRRLNKPQAGEMAAQEDMRQQLSLFTSQAKALIARCKRTMQENRRVQDQKGNMLQISQEVAAMASHLARSHIASHPELGAVLDPYAVPSFASSNPTTSTNSGSSGSPRIRPSEPRRPRGPQSGPSSGHAPVAEIPLDFPNSPDHAAVPGIPTERPASVPEILISEEYAPRSRTPPVYLPGSRRSSSDSGPGAYEAQSPTPPPATTGQIYIPTALFGPPEPRIRPNPPRQSDANLSECPVIVDDARGLREEYRRPRKVPKSS